MSGAGASVYSASEYASQELPELDVSLRGAVSIARRVQDPLAELVKIEPKSIGVGQYQHDVNLFGLARGLDAVVEDCVNAVGVDLNTASAPLLTRVSGLAAAVAGAIVRWRDAHGASKTRAQLLDVPGLGPRTFEQAAGFLRIRGGDDPLDASGGGFMALQSLWVVPWVMNVNGFDIAGAATVLVALNLGNLAGQLAVGVFGVRLARAGVQPLGLLRAGYGMMLVVQALILWSDLPVLPLWTAVCLLTAANSQIYLSAARAFPPALFGRVSTALNLMAFAGAFCVQWGFGIGLDLTRGMGVELARALAWGFGALVALQALAYLPRLGRPAARPSKGEA